MGPIASAVLAGCLGALQWLLWFSAALVVVMAGLTLFRGETSPSPPGLVVLALVMAGIGWGCAWASKMVTGQRI